MSIFKSQKVSHVCIVSFQCFTLRTLLTVFCLTDVIEKSEGIVDIIITFYELLIPKVQFSEFSEIKLKRFSSKVVP